MPKKEKKTKYKKDSRKNKNTGVFPVPQKIKRTGISPENKPDSILNLKPAWRFKYLKVEGDWGWENIKSKDKLLSIIDKLKSFETMTWKDICKNNNSHTMRLNKIAKNAQTDLLEKLTNDYDLDSVFSLRLSGKARIWGVREREAFYLLWWDPEHEIYPVTKRHT